MTLEFSKIFAIVEIHVHILPR